MSWVHSGGIKLSIGLFTLAALLGMAALQPWDWIIWSLFPWSPQLVVPACLAVVLLLLGLLIRRRVASQETTSAGTKSAPLAWWWALLTVGAVIVAIWLTTAVLLRETQTITPIAEQAKARIDAIRTGLTVGAGVGAAAGLILAFRRQYHQETATANTDHDAAEKRVTELYTKAVEQLGDDNAAVRLGGLYALERLGQDHPSHQQTVVNVLCAYLRMPYTHRDDGRGGTASRSADEPEQSPAEHGESDADRDRRNELQVRLTAQRILTTHLRTTENWTDQPGPSAGTRFWPDMAIDLTGATLVDVDFRDASFGHANFTDVSFHGIILFDQAHFEGSAWFFNARFHRWVRFTEADFTGEAGFEWARFHGEALFNGVTFGRVAVFREAEFHAEAIFQEATFPGAAIFDSTQFSAKADFDDAYFGSAVSFTETVIDGNQLSMAKTVVLDGESVHDLPDPWILKPNEDGSATVVRRAA